MSNRSFMVPGGMVTSSGSVFLLYRVVVTAWMPSLCGIFRYSDFTSIVARIQSDGTLSCSSICIMCPLSLM